MIKNIFKTLIYFLIVIPHLAQSQTSSDTKRSNTNKKDYKKYIKNIIKEEEQLKSLNNIRKEQRNAFLKKNKNDKIPKKIIKLERDLKNNPAHRYFRDAKTSFHRRYYKTYYNEYLWKHHRDLVKHYKEGNAFATYNPQSTFDSAIEDEIKKDAEEAFIKAHPTKKDRINYILELAGKLPTYYNIRHAREYNGSEYSELAAKTRSKNRKLDKKIEKLLSDIGGHYFQFQNGFYAFPKHHYTSNEPYRNFDMSIKEDVNDYIDYKGWDLKGLLNTRNKLKEVIEYIDNLKSAGLESPKINILQKYLKTMLQELNQGSEQFDYYLNACAIRTENIFLKNILKGNECIKDSANIFYRNNKIEEQGPHLPFDVKLRKIIYESCRYFAKQCSEDVIITEKNLKINENQRHLLIRMCHKKIAEKGSNFSKHIKKVLSGKLTSGVTPNTFETSIGKRVKSFADELRRNGLIQKRNRKGDCVNYKKNEITSKRNVDPDIDMAVRALKEKAKKASKKKTQLRRKHKTVHVSSIENIISCSSPSSIKSHNLKFISNDTKVQCSGKALCSVCKKDLVNGKCPKANSAKKSNIITRRVNFCCEFKSDNSDICTSQFKYVNIQTCNFEKSKGLSFSSATGTDCSTPQISSPEGRSKKTGKK